MTEVVIVKEQIGADLRRIWASLDAEGNLVISGQDIGPKVKRFFGTDEYEFAHTVPAAHIKSFFALLGVEIFEDPLKTVEKFGGSQYNKLADALEQAKESMPIKFWSRH